MMNHEKKLLLDRRRQISEKPHIDMTPKDIREYEQIIRKLNEIDIKEKREQLKKENHEMQ